MYHYAGLSSTKPPPGAPVRVSFLRQENVDERWDDELGLPEELDLPEEFALADFDRTDLSADITLAESSLRANVPSSLKWMPSG